MHSKPIVLTTGLAPQCRQQGTWWSRRGPRRLLPWPCSRCWWRRASSYDPACSRLPQPVTRPSAPSECCTASRATCSSWTSPSAAVAWVRLLPHALPYRMRAGSRSPAPTVRKWLAHRTCRHDKYCGIVEHLQDWGIDCTSRAWGHRTAAGLCCFLLSSMNSQL